MMNRYPPLPPSGPYPVDALQLHVSELEDVVKRKTIALKTSNHRRERAEETATAETAQARVAAELAKNALEEAGRKGSSLGERVQDAETRVRALRKIVAMPMTCLELIVFVAS